MSSNSFITRDTTEVRLVDHDCIALLGISSRGFFKAEHTVEIEEILTDVMNGVFSQASFKRSEIINNRNVTTETFAMVLDCFADDTDDIRYVRVTSEPAGPDDQFDIQWILHVHYEEASAPNELRVTIRFISPDMGY